MSFKTKPTIDWDKISKAAFPTLLPIGVTALGWYLYSQKKDQQQWIEKLKKPNWMVTNPKVLRIIDLAVVSPIGYAAHVVCQEARDADRQTALALYGLSVLTCTAGLPLFLTTKDLKCWFGIKALAAALFGATAYTFYKIDKTAGLLLVPITAWMTYGSIALAVTDNENTKTF